STSDPGSCRSGWVGSALMKLSYRTRQPFSLGPTFTVVDDVSPGGEWRLRAECRGADPSIFFPLTRSVDPRAFEICGACPVSVECLEAAMAEPVQRGVRGGLPPWERRALVASVES